MNLILLTDSDFIGDDTVYLSGRRYDHLCKVLKAKKGDVFRVGRVNGLIGTGEVLEIESTPARIEMRIHMTQASPKKIPVTLILAMPRPLVFKRVLMHAVTLGVERVIIMRSQRVERSYFHTPLLQPDAIQMIVTEALEQAVDTQLTPIVVYPEWWAFIEKEKTLLESERLKYVVHPGGDNPERGHGGLSCVIAIGPEGGFLQEEVDFFKQCGFKRLSLGPRILRVETAVCTALATLTR